MPGNCRGHLRKVRGKANYVGRTEAESREQARWDLVWSFYRYWVSLETETRLRKRTNLIARWQFWVIGVGGFIVGVVSAAATILALFPRK
jgi:hypothetical protein